VGFEPTIPVFERAKTVHVLYRAGTAIGLKGDTVGKIFSFGDEQQQIMHDVKSFSLLTKSI
jgi:hypothetical protein